MKFFFKLKKTKTECCKLLKEAYDENSISRAYLFEWYKWFSEGKIDLNSDQNQLNCARRSLYEHLDDC